MRLSRSQRVAIGALLAVFALLTAGIVGLVLWSTARDTPAPPAPDYSAYRADWESAMAKAGVEATFPVVPVAVEDLQVSGFRSLSATFTGPELSALATMYRYSYQAPEGTISLWHPRITFPSDGRVDVSARLVYRGSGYDVDGSVDARIRDGRLQLDAEPADLRAAGFELDGERRAQAVGVIERYVQAFLTAAPRLSIVEADIVQGAVHVEGACAQRIADPSPDGAAADPD